MVLHCIEVHLLIRPGRCQLSVDHSLQRCKRTIGIFLADQDFRRIHLDGARKRHFETAFVIAADQFVQVDCLRLGLRLHALFPSPDSCSVSRG